EDDDVGIRRQDQFLELFELALADVGAGDDVVPLLRELADDRGAGGLGQAAEFVEGILAEPGPGGKGNADQDRLLAADSHFVAGRVERHSGGKYPAGNRKSDELLYASPAAKIGHIGPIRPMKKAPRESLHAGPVVADSDQLPLGMSGLMISGLSFRAP